MKALLICAMIVATPLHAGKIGTLLQYSSFPDMTQEVGAANLWLYEHNKGGNSVLVQLNKIALKQASERQSVIDNPRTFYDAALPYIKSKGCSPTGSMKKISWNSYVVPFTC